MPIYEYRCDACGHRLEQIQKVTDPALTDCPECGQPKLKKLISAAGFQLKGTGWYVTDFKNSGAKAKNTESGKDKDKKDKPAEKTEAGKTTGTDTKKTGGSTSGGSGS